MLDPIPDKDGLKFNDDQRREYLNLTDQVGMKWLEVFEGDTEFYSAAYWDLLTGLWRMDGPRRKTDALGLMKASIPPASTWIPPLSGALSSKRTTPRTRVQSWWGYRPICGGSWMAFLMPPLASFNGPAKRSKPWVRSRKIPKIFLKQP